MSTPGILGAVTADITKFHGDGELVVFIFSANRAGGMTVGSGHHPGKKVVCNIIAEV